ncbi:hypothetical protein CRUP_019203 [Coryphaenoides rupestris]|nr:hypothetical protein CRUP_019203 [Coryphaenoides rupestris]
MAAHGAAGEEEECFEDAFERIPAARHMDLRTAIQETQCALNLVLNNKFNEALELLKPWYRDSMYHALGYSSILVMKAAMTFEHHDIQIAMTTIKDALNTCQKFRRRSSVVGSLSSLDENMISFIKGGMKIRTSYQIYKECQNMLSQGQAATSESFSQFEGGVKLGIGSFNLLMEGSANHSLRSILSALTLLFYHTYVSLILDPSEYHPDDCCLVQMLKGLCLKHLGRLLQAELCFTQVLSRERQIRYDHYLVPFTLYELGLLYKQQGDVAKATTYIENAKSNYKDYSMESRLHFRIHAALNILRGASTP